MRISLPLLTAIILTISSTAHATFSDIPRYHEQLDFNLTSPSAFTTAAGGYANPAVYRVMPGSELEYYWQSPDENPLGGGLNKWGLFWGARGLGFGAIHQRVPNGTEGYDSVTDYRLALSTGTARSTFGISLGWSRGNTDELGRTTVIQVGMVERSNRFVSFSAAGTFSTAKADQTGVFDLAIRPLGDHRVTVFGDFELPRGYGLSNAPWSTGAMLEVPDGIRVIGRYFDDESFSLGLVYSFGGPVNTGHLRGSWNPHYAKGGDYAGSNWGVRMGFAERNELIEKLFKGDHYVQMQVRGPITHRRFKFLDRRLTLASIIKALEAARTDDRVGGIALSLSGARLTSAHAWEIRRKLAQVQSEGKRVVVFIDRAGMSTYHLASVADHIVMDPDGMLTLPGYAISRTYMTDLIAKLGLKVDEWRFKDYKSAIEILVRNDMSDEDREQRQALVDQYYATAQSEVSAGRGVDESTFDEWVDDQTLFSPETALELGLVDELGRWEEVGAAVRELENKRKWFMSPGAMAEYQYQSQQWGDRPRVAIVYGVGGTAMDSGIRSRRLEGVINRLASDRRVKAIVFRVNSPGGSPMAADVVAEALRKCAQRKPVIVTQGDVAASGGYWISMYGTRVLTTPTTVTGSIGVIAGWVYDDGLKEKLGLDHDYVKAGEHADLFSNVRLPYIPLSVAHRGVTDTERERIIKELSIAYDRFVTRVAEARDMSISEVEEIARGRVWSGTEAVELGLVDEIGGLDDAIRIAVEEAGIGNQDYRIVDLGLAGLFDPALFSPIPYVGTFFARDAGMTEEQALSFLSEYDAMYLERMVERAGQPLFMLAPEMMMQQSSAFE